MKKFIYLLVFVFAAYSCSNSFLDSRPTSGVTTDIAITNISEARYAINGIYNELQSYGYYGAAMFYIGDVKGDDMQSYAITSRTSNYCYLFDHKSYSVNASSIWGQAYYVVRLAYNIINAIESGKVSDGTETEKNNIIGHAKALIAMAHFDLTKLWGYPYAKDGGASLGVPIVEHALGVDEYPDRSTVKQCYEFIIGNLTEAIPMMTTEKDAGKMNAYGARALLSRAYLYSTDYQKAFDTASELIEELKANGAYALYSHDDYMASFALDAKLGSESLMEIVNSSSDNESWDCLAYLIHPYGYKENILTKDFEDLLNEDPDDVRYGMMRIEPTLQNRPFLNKYPGPSPDKASRDNNYTVLRLSEVYLIAAEAAINLNAEDRAKGLGYLNEIVKRGNPDNEVTDAEYDLDRVLAERRKELVGEGHRYFDMLRNGKTIIRKGGYHLAGAPEEINWNTEKCVLPIPAAQFVFNPEMEQNPGYTKE